MNAQKPTAGEVKTIAAYYMIEKARELLKEAEQLTIKPVPNVEVAQTLLDRMQGKEDLIHKTSLPLISVMHKYNIDELTISLKDTTASIELKDTTKAKI